MGNSGAPARAGAVRGQSQCRVLVAALPQCKEQALVRECVSKIRLRGTSDAPTNAHLRTACKAARWRPEIAVSQNPIQVAGVNRMKPRDERSSAKSREGATQAAVASTRGNDTLNTAHVKVQGKRGEKAVKADIAASGKNERDTDSFAPFAGSDVMAHDAVLRGLPGRVLIRIWESTRETLFADAILNAIGVSARTAHRIKTHPDKPLDARTTDGIYRLQSVRAIAEEVLGGVEAANEWLNTEAMGLEFRRPIDLLSTSPGAEAVKTLLQRMKYGVYA